MLKGTNHNQILKGNNHNEKQILPYTRSKSLTVLGFGGRRFKSLTCTPSMEITRIKTSTEITAIS
ncbi:hypothetical protein Hanom_Chr02g00117751 [Helianthus anomalus]